MTQDMELIREAIAAKIEGVADAGIVQRHERWAQRQDKFRVRYEQDGKIKGWFVRRVRRRSRVLTFKVNEVQNSWVIRGFRSFNDEAASEIEFDRLIESIVEAFRADDTLGGTVITCTTPQASGLQLTESAPVMFAGALCHGAELELTTVTLEGPDEADPVYLRELYLNGDLVASSGDGDA
ncbi:hypothetical protein ACSHT0_06560 [Tepidicaulis sp. LMO-SS28]|uniref:hypothetical protein n=1 Tax=Tepidicaulis sp. LMO-SS28 TaxID=3447455 RepID=UPI003EDEC803